MNTICIIGNLATDPETGKTKAGESWTRFRVAVSNGKETADFFTVKAFGRTAEVVAEYASKGRRVGVTGRLASHSYTRQDKQQVYAVEIVAQRVELLGKRDDTATGEATPTPAAVVGTSLDDIPF